MSGPAADQYSLALLYTEMLTGIYPRTKAPPGKSGMHRRPKPPDAGSGLHAAGAASAAGGPGKVDLDFLPPDDRPVAARALHDDPAQRFPSCAGLHPGLAGRDARRRRHGGHAGVAAAGDAVRLPDGQGAARRHRRCRRRMKSRRN